MRRLSGVSCDNGSGTVWVLTLCALLWFSALSSVALLSVRTDRHRAVAAADLAAIAGAGAAARGAASACARAQSTAEANDARLTDCTLSSLTVTVEVAVAVRLWPRHRVSATARAGPVDTAAGQSRLPTAKAFACSFNEPLPRRSPALRPHGHRSESPCPSRSAPADWRQPPPQSPSSSAAAPSPSPTQAAALPSGRTGSRSVPRTAVRWNCPAPRSGAGTPVTKTPPPNRNVPVHRSCGT
ncbi:Rv3654c family TadE-like protein [Nocardiopsis ansamitocini]|uniref:Rv3654c family TadE-like protein n=1 Tax=Nocardiopsis ansamitocini TaxID=1670832 RepID=UPI002557AA74|nr:Rv3654c family TadE-like protein [Nocardiopsis ansamitocini]